LILVALHYPALSTQTQQGVAPHNHGEERETTSRAEGREEQPWILARGNDDGRGAALGREVALEKCSQEGCAGENFT
jgi:hypothetical protein